MLKKSKKRGPQSLAWGGLFPLLWRGKGEDKTADNQKTDSKPAESGSTELDYKTLSCQLVSVQRFLDGTATTYDLSVIRRIDHWQSVFNAPAFPRNRLSALIDKLNAAGFGHVAAIAAKYVPENGEQSEDEQVVDIFLKKFNIPKENIVPTSSEDKARKSILDERAKAKFREVRNGLLPRG